MELTERQQQILDWITAFIAEHGYSPTVREIGAAHGIRSPNGIMCHLSALRRKGRITWVPQLGRTIRVVGQEAGE